MGGGRGLARADGAARGRWGCGRGLAMRRPGRSVGAAPEQFGTAGMRKGSAALRTSAVKAVPPPGPLCVRSRSHPAVQNGGCRAAGPDGGSAVSFCVISPWTHSGCWVLFAAGELKGKGRNVNAGWWYPGDAGCSAGWGFWGLCSDRQGTELSSCWEPAGQQGAGVTTSTSSCWAGSAECTDGVLE